MEWGIRPILFKIFGLSVTSYAFFVALALIIGLVLYFRGIHELGKRDPEKGILLVVFAVLGGAIGAKLPLLFMYWDVLMKEPEKDTLIFSGRTIIGGLLGGFLGAFLARRWLGIKVRMGNYIAIPLAVGMAIGRIGCFLTGCCYGKPTELPWGIDFGDHILRHPTQLYEMIFDLALAGWLILRKQKNPLPGQLFRQFLSGYLGFRFFLEFIRVERISAFGLTDFQLICIISLVFIHREKLLKGIRKNRVQEEIENG